MNLRLQRDELPSSSKVEWKALVLVILLVVAFGFPSLFFPFGRDQGIHAHVACFWLQGRWPFRDVWVQKGPLAFVPHLLVTALFGRTMWGIRLFDLVWQAGCSWLIYLIARRRMKWGWALLSVGVYLLAYFAGGYWHTAHIEGFLSPFVLLSVFLYERAGKSARSNLLLFMSGFSVGLSPWFKQTALVYAIGLFAWALVDHWSLKKDSLKPLLTRWAILGFGFLISATLVVSVLSIAGALESMLSIWQYSFFSYSGAGDTNDITLLWDTSLDWVSRYALLALPFLGGMGYLFFHLQERRRWTGVIFMALCGLAGIYAQRRLWDYHWVSTMPLMALVAALSIRVAVEALSHCNNSRRKKMVWLLPLVGVGLALPILRVHGEAYLNTVAYVSGHRSELEHLKAFGMRDVYQVADYVRRRTTDEDYLFIWGHYPAIYYLSGRQNPTRFGMDPPLSLSHAKQHFWQQECMGDLYAHPPEYILVVTDDITPFEPITSKQQLSGFPELEEFLNEEYAYDRRVGDFEVYARLSQPENSMNAKFEGGITLAGYDLYANCQPNGMASVELYWSSAISIETDYTVFVQMVDWSGPLVVAQSDTYPAHGQRPTQGWQLGQPVLDTHDLILPVDLQPGEYEIIVGMYDLNTMERLPVTSGGTADNYVSLGKLTYKPED